MDRLYQFGDATFVSEFHRALARAEPGVDESVRVEALVQSVTLVLHGFAGRYVSARACGWPLSGGVAPG